MQLTKYEKETIILWNQSDDDASVYTFDPDLKRRLAKFAEEQPECCRLKRTTPEGSVTYLINKQRLSILLMVPYSEERKKASGERAKQQHGLKASEF